jgi:hypothetical protein
VLRVGERLLPLDLAANAAEHVERIAHVDAERVEIRRLAADVATLAQPRRSLPVCAGGRRDLGEQAALRRVHRLARLRERRARRSERGIARDRLREHALEIGRAEQRPPLRGDLAPQLDPLHRRACRRLHARGDRVAAVAIDVGRIRPYEVGADRAAAAEQSQPHACDPSHRESFHSYRSASIGSSSAARRAG